MITRAQARIGAGVISGERGQPRLVRPVVGQQQALGKAAGQGRVGGGNTCGIKGLHGGQAGNLGLAVFEQAAQARRVACILAVPDDERAVLLPVHRRGQRRDQLRPARERMLAHAHDAGLGHHRFGQGCDHGRGHIGGRSHAVGAAGLENLHAVALARQAGGQQAAQQARAQDGDRRRGRKQWLHGVLSAIQSKPWGDKTGAKGGVALVVENSPRQHDLDRVRRVFLSRQPGWAGTPLFRP